jgi:epoxyqueuosine reductase
MRNIAVALGNAPRSAKAAAALEQRLDDPSPLVREHAAWALARQRAMERHSRASGNPGS